MAAKTKEYRELVLVKVERPYFKTVQYFAVTEETAENMDNTSSAMQYIHKTGTEYAEAQFNVIELGKILVEPEDD